jgi:hypothetical protein
MTDDDTEIWQSGTVDLPKLKTGFSYLHSSISTFPLCNPLQPHLQPPPMHNPSSHRHKHIRKQTHRIERCPTTKTINTALLDSGATCHFNKPSDDLPIIGPSHKTIAMAFGQVANTSATALLPMMHCVHRCNRHTSYPRCHPTHSSASAPLPTMDMSPSFTKVTKEQRFMTTMTS